MVDLEIFGGVDGRLFSAVLLVEGGTYPKYPPSC